MGINMQENISSEEMLEILDDNGRPTGRAKTRRLVHRDGDAHATSHVWIIRADNIGKTGYDILLQKRSHNKDSFPDCYDISSAGHIPFGQGYIESAIRELKEELGIDASEEELEFIGVHDAFNRAEFYGQPFLNHEISNVYLLERGPEAVEFRLQPEEVQSVMWIDFDECYNNVKNNQFEHCICMDEMDMLYDALSHRKSH